MIFQPLYHRIFFFQGKCQIVKRLVTCNSTVNLSGRFLHTYIDIAHIHQFFHHPDGSIQDFLKIQGF